MIAKTLVPTNTKKSGKHGKLLDSVPDQNLRTLIRLTTLRKSCKNKDRNFKKIDCRKESRRTRKAKVKRNINSS